MKSMIDYSGQFQPDLQAEDFSPETLVGLLGLYRRLYIALDGFWYLTVKQRSGNDEALASDIETWEKHCKYEMSNITRQLNIQGNDVAALVKALQLTPWFMNTGYRFDLEGPNQALLSVTSCPTLAALQEEGEGREHQICNVVDKKAFEYYASFFNPDIEVRKLVSPSRSGQNDICCQWEFVLEGKGQAVS